MSGKGKHTKSKKRKVTDACSICIGRGRIEESKNHSGQYCAHAGGPYEGDWKKAKRAKKTEEDQLKDLLEKEQREVSPLQIRDERCLGESQTAEDSLRSSSTQRTSRTCSTTAMGNGSL